MLPRWQVDHVSTIRAQRGRSECLVPRMRGVETDDWRLKVIQIVTHDDAG